MKMEEYYISSKKLKKSLAILYPLVGFKKEEEPTGAESFLYWTEMDDSIDDYKLIVYFKTNYDDTFRKFEESKIKTKSNLTGCYEVEEGIVYIFDLVEYADTVAEFLEGNYSKIKIDVKNKILDYSDSSKDKTVRPGREIHMILFPLLYKEVVSAELGEDIRGELAAKYDLEDEICNLKIIDKDCECSGDKTTYYLT
jgi:hypothetical protein